MPTLNAPQMVKIESSGREVYLDTDCDHDPEVVSVQTQVDPLTTRREYYWNCTKCQKHVAPLIFGEHPCGFTGIRW
jgi:hypothetical protein